MNATTTNVPSVPTSEPGPSGAAAAVVVSAGIGTFSLGLFVALSAASPSLAKALDVFAPTGPLSGKTSAAVGAWLLSWAALHARWRRRDVPFSRWWHRALALVALGIVLTFPPVYDLFAPRP
jgi:hypothetical protein